MQHSLHTDQGTGLVCEFRELAKKLAEYYGSYGVKVVPFHSPELPHFSALPKPKQQAAVACLAAQWEIASLNIFNQVGADNNAKALWNALKVYGLVPSSDLFSKLESDDKIEVYTLDGIQVWRNLSVMELCSYTFEELHSYSWAECYHRADVDNAALFMAVGELLKKNEKVGLFAGIPYHVVEEKFSQERLRLKVRHDYLFPLYNRDNAICAFVATSKAEELPKEKPLSSSRSFLNLVPNTTH